MMRLYRACGAGEERGAAVVEFALVAPVLLLILLGMLDFGKVFNYWIDETQLASAGSRWAVVNSWPGKASGTPLSQYIQQQADTAELKNGGTKAVPNKARVCIRFPNGSSDIGQPVEVTVSVSYHWLPVIGKKLLTPSSTITGKSTMRIEAPPPLGYSNNECYPAS